MFHAGTKENKNLVTNGGRVLAVSTYGKDAQDAVQRALKDVEKITFDKMYYRKDIGFDL